MFIFFIGLIVGGLIGALITAVTMLEKEFLKDDN